MDISATFLTTKIKCHVQLLILRRNRQWPDNTLILDRFPSQDHIKVILKGSWRKKKKRFVMSKDIRKSQHSPYRGSTQIRHVLRC